jgi:hypothetical protein
MPMRYVSPLISAARNKIGGLVYAANPSGQYVRAKVIPAQPRTPAQQAGRARFAAIAASWKSLDQTVRVAWNSYAEGVYQRDSLGQRVSICGYNQFVRCSLNLQLIGGTGVPAVPLLGLAGLNLSIAPQDCRVLLPDLVQWIILPGAGTPFVGTALLWAATPSLSTAVNFVARQTYRTLAPPFPSSGGGIDIGPAYYARFGAPTVGSNVAVRMTQINPVTGIAATPRPFILPVTD